MSGTALLPTLGLPRVGTPRDPSLPTLGPRVAQLSQLLGVPFMPWQRHVLEVGGERRGDRWRRQVVIVHVQRRSGKSTSTFVRQAHRAATCPRSQLWYGAQSRKDGVEIWNQQITEHLLPAKDRLRFKVRRSIGSESVRYANGSQVSLFTPAESALVGLATDDVTVDEARFHSVPRGLALEAGIRPTQATRDGQLWIVSSAGVFGVSDWLWGWLERGRASLDDPDSPIAFFDYSMPPDADPADIDQVAAHHPAVGHTITRDFIAAEADSMEPLDFAREYGGIWTRTVTRQIDPAAWTAGADPARPMPAPGDLVLAFSISPDGGMGAVTAGWDCPDGHRYGAVLDQRPGDAWMLDRVVELAGRWKPRAVVYNAVGPAVGLGDQLARRGGMRLVPVGLGDNIIACKQLDARIRAGQFRHHGQPDLDDAAEGAAIRRLRTGDGWVWAHGTSSVPIVALEGVTLATWAVDHYPKRERLVVG